MSHFRLHVLPQVPPMDFDTFCEMSPPFSISLDGFVNEGPKFQEEGPRANYNHHEGVARLETRATCAQVLISIRQGLFDCFRDDKGNRVELFVNDCDEDVATSVFLLKNPHLVTPTINPLLNRLVSMEDTLDATAGAYPFPTDLPSLRALAWIFEPYRRFRSSGQLDKKDSDSYRAVISDIGLRIMSYLVGEHQSIDLDTRYEVIGGNAAWKMVREIGSQARTGMFSDGVRAYVSVRERHDGRYTYTLGRMSTFVRFPINMFLDRLNEVEKTTIDKWGGSETIAGSPRVTGSGLKPEELQAIIEDCMKEKYS